jgi:hypothetical protein
MRADVRSRACLLSMPSSPQSLLLPANIDTFYNAASDLGFQRWTPAFISTRTAIPTNDARKYWLARQAKWKGSCHFNNYFKQVFTDSKSLTWVAENPYNPVASRFTEHTPKNSLRPVPATRKGGHGLHGLGQECCVSSFCNLRLRSLPA